MSFHHRTVINGRGYRFTLPALGLPDPKGSWAVVQVATSMKDPDLVNVPEKPANGALPEMRFPDSQQHTQNVTHDGAIWILPIPSIEAKDDPYFFAIRVKRTLSDWQRVDFKTSKAEPKKGKTKNATPPSPTSSDAPSSSTSKLRNREPISIDQPGSLRNTLAEAELKRDKKKTNAQKQHKRPGVPMPLPGGGMGCCVDCIKIQGAARGNLLLEPDVHAEIQLDSNYGLRWIVYADTLPNGDRVPDRLVNHESFHAEDTPWAIVRRQRTFYHQAKTPPQVRAKLWAAFTGNGQPCHVQDGKLFVNFSLPRDYSFEVSNIRLANGSALLKVVEKPEDYDCHPSAASAEASYFLHRYQLLVEQRGRQYSAIEPLARFIDGGEDSVLSMLGQYAQLEAGDPYKDRMIFCSVAGPKPIPGLDDLYNVGVRLRDGGARFEISSSSCIKMPGGPLHHTLFGEYHRMSSIKDEMDAKAAIEEERHVRIRAQISAGQQDIVLRVVDQARGLYDELEYAFREKGSFESVREGEWKRFGTPMVDEWVVWFFLNMARQSYGRHEYGDYAGRDGDRDSGSSEG